MQALSLFQNGPQRLEELRQTQFVVEQVLREDRKARAERSAAEGMFVGHEPGEDQQDGRGGAEMVAEGSARYQTRHGQSW